jgi:hypothetical protein
MRSVCEQGKQANENAHQSKNGSRIMKVLRQDSNCCPANSSSGSKSTRQRRVCHYLSSTDLIASSKRQRRPEREITEMLASSLPALAPNMTVETTTTVAGGRRAIMPNRRARAIRPLSSSSPSSPPILVSLLVVAVIGALSIGSPEWAAQGQCLDKTMTSFERIGGVTIKDAQLTILYQANMSQATIGHHHHHHHGNHHASLSSSSVGPAGNSTTTTTLYQISTPITAECNNRCRRMKECRAFLVDYGRHTCWSVNHPATPAGHHQSAGGGSSPSSGGGSGLSSSLAGGSVSFNVLDRSPAPIHLELTNERTAYFEKVCLNLPIVECERAWIFERVLSYHIHGHDDKIIDDVPSRLKCQEHCLNERQFRCRSGEYDYLTMQCRLSMVDRHMKQSQFRPTSSNIDYFENQCVPTGQQCDAFDRFEDMDLGRAEIMRVVNNSEQCQQFCTQTIKAFVCRSFTWSPLTGRCYLNSANTFMVGGMDKLLQAPGLVYYQRNDCIDLKLECDTTSMTLNLRTNEPFRGRMYVRDGDPQACAPTLGRSALMSSLSIPFQSPMGRCATRELPSRYSSVVVVQQHPLIQRKSDRYIKLVCDFQTANKTISSSYNVMANPWTSTALINATSFAPKILLRITDKFGHDVTGAKLGDELQLRIEAETDSPYDMTARSVLAKSGSSDAESIVLIDRDGCPADFRIFPPLKKLNKRTIIGRFDAFKFSSDAVVRFQVDVQFCLNSCPQTNCLDPSQTLFNVNSQQLGGAGGDSGDGGASNEQLVPSSSAPMASTSTTSSPTGLMQPPTGANQNDETSSSLAAGPLEYMRSSSTTYRPMAAVNPDYLATNSLMDQFGGAGGILGSRRSQPPANQPLGGHPEQVASLATSQTSPMNNANNNNNNQMPTSDQLFDPQAKDSGRLLAAANDHQHQYNARHSGPNQHGYHNQQRQAQQHKQQAAYGAQSAMQSNGLDQLDLGAGELSAAMGQQQQSQEQSLHQRRRRSVEPMPATPKHVPLQREIIIFESGATKEEHQQTASKKGQTTGDELAPADGGRVMTGSRQQAGVKLARGHTNARSSQQQQSNAPTIQSSSKRGQKANGHNEQGECKVRSVICGGSVVDVD